jgi:hypothetical protein
VFLCVFAYSDVQHFSVAHVVSFVLPVFFDCPFVIALSDFSNVYLK